MKVAVESSDRGIDRHFAVIDYLLSFSMCLHLGNRNVLLENLFLAKFTIRNKIVKLYLVK